MWSVYQSLFNHLTLYMYSLFCKPSAQTSKTSWFIIIKMVLKFYMKDPQSLVKLLES